MRQTPKWKSGLLRRLLLAGLLTALMAPLAACATTTGSVETRYIDSACAIVNGTPVDPPISWSPSDTDQTIKEVKRHNAIHKELCP